MSFLWLPGSLSSTLTARRTFILQWAPALLPQEGASRLTGDESGGSWNSCSKGSRRRLTKKSLRLPEVEPAPLHRHPAGSIQPGTFPTQSVNGQGWPEPLWARLPFHRAPALCLRELRALMEGTLDLRTGLSQARAGQAGRRRGWRTAPDRLSGGSQDGAAGQTATTVPRRALCAAQGMGTRDGGADVGRGGILQGLVSGTLGFMRSPSDL